MDVESLDLLQFHWWEYGDERYLDALGHMADLQREGKIKHLALTNFDTEHLATIVRHGIRIVSNQVQYSIIDRRPATQDGAVLPRPRRRAAYLRHGLRRAAERSLPGRAADRAGRNSTPRHCRNTAA